MSGRDPGAGERSGSGVVSVMAVVASGLLLASAARVSVPLDPSGVPQTLQTLVVVLLPLVLGGWLGAASVVLYLLLGASGVPVFAGGRSGTDVLLGPTGGYLLGFLLGQPVVAALARRRGGVPRGWAGLTGAGLAGHLAILTLGVPWLWIARGQSSELEPLTLGAAIETGALVFVPGMVVKSALAAALACAIRRFVRSAATP